MRKTNSTFVVKYVRRAAAAAAVILSVVIAVRFAVRWPRRPEPAVPPLADAKVDRKEAVRHQEFKDGRLQDEIRADRLYLGADGLNHLEGGVEILDHAKEPGQETEIRADAVAYDKDLTRFTMSGDVRIRSGDLEFSSSSVVYDRTNRRFRTDDKGAFATPRLSGTAQTVIYDDGRGEVELSRGFRVEVKEGDGRGETAIIEGDTFSYLREGRTGSVDGSAHVIRRDAEAWAERLTFVATPDESAFAEMSLDGTARCILTDAPEGEGRSLAGAGGRTIQADHLRIESTPGSRRISAVEARGNARLILRGAGDTDLTVSSETAVLNFDTAGVFVEAEASVGAMVNLEAEPGEPWTVEAAAVIYDKRAGKLTARGASGAALNSTAVIASARFKVEAPSLVLDTTAKTLDAAGPGIRCALEPAKAETVPALFSGGDRIFITGGRLSSSGRGSASRFVFSGGARAWQGSRSIRAGALEIGMESGEAVGRDGVAVSLLKADRDGAGPEAIEAGGRNMRSTPAERSLAFTGKGFIRLPAAGLTAETVTVHLDEKEGIVAAVTASGGVVIKKGDYEGRGVAAVYDPREDTIVLTGQALLTAKDKGTSRGSKLTFHLGDGRILIENDGQGRSITIVKS